jgi:hypothetical protein
VGPRVRYRSSAELVSDWDAQLSRGGMLVRAEAPEGTQQFDPVVLVLESPAGRVELQAQVMQLFPGVGTAVTFPSSPELAELVAAARASSIAGGPSEHAWGDEEASAAAAFKGAQGKIAHALRGNRDERTTILREGNPTLQGYVLRNPSLQLDEVAAMAKMRTVTPELLKQIADKREWASRPEIAVALVRNPKTPVGIAIRLLDHVPPAELRQLAKDQHTRAPIQQAARKKVVG